MTQRMFRRGARGFTFLEIMMVVVIIGVLMSVVGPRLVGRTEKARFAAVESQIQSFRTALQSFEMTTGRFPTTEEGLKALIIKPGGLDDAEWDGPYLDGEIPLDPWRRPYNYVRPGQKSLDYDLWSNGPDRQSGTEDDIGNWPKGATTAR